MVLGLKVLAVTLLFTACASQLQTLTPSTSFLTSETQGELFKTAIAAGAVEGTNTYATLDENSTDIEFKAKKSFTHIMVMPQVGLGKKVDAFVKVTSHAPFIYGLKLQLFGHTKMEARKGRDSFSIYMGGGRKRYTFPSEFNLESQGDYRADRDDTIIEMGAIYGKRIYSDILLYGRYSKISQDSHGKIKFEENPNINDEEFKISGDHLSYGLGVVWYTRKINLGFELTALETNWNNASNTSAMSLLLAVSRDIN